MLNIRYSSNNTITAEQFVDLLKWSTLDQRRPVDGKNRMEQFQYCFIIKIKHA
jgi:hypothetical protein